MSSEGHLDTKVFNDPIHGHIELHPLCIKIIDTPQFQRLRYLKQLGACYFVFPGASHNRFEHSLGVGYLAGELVRQLRSRQEHLHISEEDILCVQIAGLCHDLGHGPFSHMFDNRFIPLTGNKDWQHEKASVAMFDYLVEDNKLLPEFDKYNLTEKDLTFIKEQIAGPLTVKNLTLIKEQTVGPFSPSRQEEKDEKAWLYQGREKDKCFLYEVVANKRNGIDVDKWDYFARDCHHLGIRSNFDHARFMKFARVIDVEGESQICSRDKEIGNLYDMFYTRNVLHRRAYQHKNCAIIESMITEAFLIANDVLTFEGKDGVSLKLSETITDMRAYVQVHDGVFHTIRYSDDPRLAGARALLDKIERRELYKFIGQSRPKNQEETIKFSEEQMLKEISLCADNSKSEIKLSSSDFVVQICKYDYGMKERNPIDNVRFYSKGNPSQAMIFRKNEVSHMLPERFSDQYVRVYCKERGAESVKAAHDCFQLFCEKNKYISPKGGDPGTIELTPMSEEIHRKRTLVPGPSCDTPDTHAPKRSRVIDFSKDTNE